MAKPERKPVQTRRAVMQLNSFDPETGTFSAIAATETPVLRSDFFQGSYWEVLSLAPNAVRLGRITGGRTPLLDAHRRTSSRDQLGVVTGGRIESKRLVIDGQLSPRADVKPIAADIEAGIIRNVSVAYLVFASVETTAPDGVRTITRTDWEPMEVSIVPVGADPAAFIRSSKGNAMATRPRPTSAARRTAAARAVQIADDHNEDVIDQDIDDLGDDDETDVLLTRSPAPAPAALSAQQVTAARRSVQAFGLTDDFANRCIADGMSLQQIRNAAQNEVVARAPRRQNPHHLLSQNAGDVELAQAIGDALHGRMTGKPPAEGRGRELMGRSILELGTMLLESRGERVAWTSRDALATRIMTRSTLGGLHSTSDFPTLLASSGNRVLLEAYKAAESPLKAIARRRDAADFRALSTVRLGEAPKLLEVPEGGEVKYGTIAEAKESFRVKTFARIFGLTRQAIINDDLGAFADTNMAWGRAAAEAEATQLVALFTANSGNGVTLDDSAALYTTGRTNKAATGTVIDITNLGVARKAMREMKGLDGTTPISATPKHLVVGAAKETEAEQVLTAIAAAQVSNANPFSGKLELHVEPRLTGNAWRLFADPAEIATIAIAYLNGQEGPQMEVKEGWEVLGTEFRCVLDFGCGITDWRGTYLNAGN